MFVHLFSAVVLLSICAVSAFCQGNISINVGPPKVDISILPGRSFTGLVNVTNTGTVPVHITVYPSDLSVDLDGELSFLEAGTTPYSCANWLKINPEEFDLVQVMSVPVRYTVEAPENATGSYAATIFCQTRPQQLRGWGVATSARVGTIVVVTIAGTGFKKGEIISMNLSPAIRDRPSEILITFKNSGNILLRPKGNIEIKDIGGVLWFNLPINEDEAGVLPQSSKRFRVPLPTVMSPGRYKFSATLDYGGEELLLGEAYAEVIPSYTLAAKLMEQEKPISSPQPSEGRLTKREKREKPAVERVDQAQIQALYQEGIRLYTSEQYMDALKIWQKILRLDPSHSGAKRNLSKTAGKIEALRKAKAK